MLLDNSSLTTGLAILHDPSPFSTSYSKWFHGIFNHFYLHHSISMCSFHPLFRPSSASTIFPLFSLMQLLPVRSFASLIIILILRNTTFLSFCISSISFTAFFFIASATALLAFFCQRDSESYFQLMRVASTSENFLSSLRWLFAHPGLTTKFHRTEAYPYSQQL